MTGADYSREREVNWKDRQRILELEAQLQKEKGNWEPIQQQIKPSPPGSGYNFYDQHCKKIECCECKQPACPFC